ncbi:MAG: signal recognition particle protein [Nitrososphaerota archaeon]|nr:signal recognition particle protein [Nitrososphaerota archaeon]MDG7049216.1 signal recognition particle protein [Nitrososphaerota archaeon]MDG7051999.1 signal recognition particle protein [Nitrososphaerota archaeon]
MLDDLKKGLKEALDRLMNRSSIDEEALREFSLDVQRTLLKGDVNVRQVLELTKNVQERLTREGRVPGVSVKELAVRALYEEMSKLLGGDNVLPIQPKNLILMMGIQGSGKTTLAAKLARYYTVKGMSVGLITTDVYRPGAYEQLKSLGDRIKVEVYYREGAKPVDIAKEGIARFSSKNMVIIDTAGRHKEERSLLQEMTSLERAISPTFTMLVVDGTSGQQIFNQAKAFSEAVKVGGIAITKLDGTAKGGGALAAAAATGAKVYFISEGERLEDIEEFSATRFVGRLLGIGDLKGLIERVKQAEITVKEEEVKKALSGRMDLQGFLDQMEQMNKLGPLEKVLEMLPGAPKVNEEDIQKAKAQMEKWKAAIRSMTPEERKDPKVINASRIRRIARGSGITEKDVRALLDAFGKGKSFMKMAKRMRLPPGLG